ncbi:MAG: nuclear transport factor 2 family protein [Hyphomicrobiales bacterium]|nr:nuclear transport factor 2 family protein [Hyphomicrobiales bacterium]
MQSDNASRKLAEVDRELIEQRIHALAEMRARGDMAGMLEFAAPDIVFKGGTWLSYPLNARFEGREACKALSHAVLVAYENLGSTINKLLIDGDRVALHRTARIRNRGTGKTVSVEICNFLRFRDGLVVEFSEYPDTAAVARLDEQ